MQFPVNLQGKRSFQTTLSWTEFVQGGAGMPAHLPDPV